MNILCHFFNQDAATPAASRRQDANKTIVETNSQL
jgi:hypothetical protein